MDQYLPMTPVPLVFPHDSVQSSILAAVSNHSTNVIGRTGITGLVQMTTDAEFLSGGLQHYTAIVVVHVSWAVPQRHIQE